jgi:NAD(P)-dependent dehydrogenase (short-subunit alcohol dehydrogenase family)
MKKTVIITGASSGIGLETALLFFEKGWNVVATMRNPQRRKTRLHEKNMDLQHLDVMDPVSVKKVIEYARKKYGSIDVLVNNAGYAVRGPFELSDPAQVQTQFDTNVLGLMDVCRLIIPVFRAQKGGTLINIASIGGKSTIPFYSVYNSSKFAVEGFSECLHYELRPFNIKVRIIEPGYIRTDFYDRSLVDTQCKKKNVYTEMYEKSLKKTDAFGKNASHPRVMARVIFRAAVSRGNRLRYYGGNNAGTVLFLRKLLPDPFFFWIIRTFTM